MKKHLFLGFIALTLTILSPICAQGQLRENVAIVRPIYTPSTVKFLTDFSNLLKRNGYNTSAEVLKSYIDGGFGSGFVYVDSLSKKSYIITNRHVVAQANYATVEFSVPDQALVIYKECPVIAVDDYLDLALIALPSDAKVPNGLTILTKTPEDGTEVFSAGFPGLASEPSWQLGHGIISNSSVHNKILSGSETTGVIQHTAQVDAGSSGGPLMVRGADKSNYEIIGINTWKSEGRENVNFAISGTSITKFLENHVNISRYDMKSLESRVTNFASAINIDYKSVYPYISSEYVSNISVVGFFDLLDSNSEAARKDVINCFNNGRPIDGVRIALADIMCKKFNKRSMSFQSVNNNADKATTAFVTVNYGEQPISTEWEQEQGYWRIKQLSALKTNNLEDNGISTQYGYRNSFKLGVNIPSSDIENVQFMGSFIRSHYTFVTSGFSFGRGSMDLLTTETNFDVSPFRTDTVSFNKKYFFFDLEFGGQLPIKMSNIYLVPNARALVGMNFGDYTGALTYGFTAGAEVAYKLSGRTYLLGGLDFRYKVYGTQDYDFGGEENAKFSPYSTIGIHVGITW